MFQLLTQLKEFLGLLTELFLGFFRVDSAAILRVLLQEIGSYPGRIPYVVDDFLCRLLQLGYHLNRGRAIADDGDLLACPVICLVPTKSKRLVCALVKG
jgi:hypothetical protein